MKKKTTRTSLLTRRTTLVAMVLMVLFVSGVAVVLSQTNNSTNATTTWYNPKPGYALMNLTQDQKNQLYQTISQLKLSGATPDQIKANITQTLHGFGINVTSIPDLGFGFRHFGHFREFRPMALNGFILKATDGSNCYNVTVNNSGTLNTALVTCP